MAGLVIDAHAVHGVRVADDGFRLWRNIPGNTEFIVVRLTENPVKR